MSKEEKKTIEKCIEYLKMDGINSKAIVIEILENMEEKKMNSLEALKEIKVNWKTKHNIEGNIIIKTLDLETGYVWTNHKKYSTFGIDSIVAKECYPTIPMLMNEYIKEKLKAYNEIINADVNEASNELEQLISVTVDGNRVLSNVKNYFKKAKLLEEENKQLKSLLGLGGE